MPHHCNQPDSCSVSSTPTIVPTETFIEMSTDNPEFYLTAHNHHEHNKTQHPSHSPLVRYPYTSDLLQLESQGERNPADLPAHARTVTTPLVADQWEALLRSHPDRPLAQYITTGIRQGFRIGFRSDHKCKRAAGNMRSATENPKPVEDFVQTEVKAGRIIGPLPDMHHIHISRFGVIPKQGQPGRWRLILDLSSPKDCSVNDGIPTELCSIKYASVDTAVQRIMELGRNSLLAKIDIEHAYRNVPVHPDERHLLGMYWGGAVYIDTVLPFGLRSAPKIFSAIADTLEWIARQEGVSVLLHYLDDFLTMGKENTQECQCNLEKLINLCHCLGVPLKWQKLEGPATSLTFLGILLDTRKMEMRLLEEKLRDLKELITRWMGRKSGKKRDFLSLIGKLSHATKIIVPGRIFLRRMIQVAHRVKHLDHWVHLTHDFKSDLAWWQLFIDTWNGKGMMQSVAASWSPRFSFSTDASGSWGCGACWGDRWIQCAWNGVWSGVNIATKELLPILLAVAMWGAYWHGSQVLVRCDNMAVVQIMAANSSKDAVVMHLLRGLHFFSAYYNINMQVVHIPGAVNTCADAISRNLMQVFFKENPSARRSPTPIPDCLWDILVRTQPDWRSESWKRSLVASLELASQIVQEESMLLANPHTSPFVASLTSTPSQPLNSS